MNVQLHHNFDPIPIAALIFFAWSLVVLGEAVKLAFFAIRMKLWAKVDDSDWDRMVDGLSRIDGNPVFGGRHRNGASEGRKESD